MHSIHVPLTVPLGDTPCEVTQPGEVEASFVVPQRRSIRTIIPSMRYIDFLLTESSVITISELEEPTSYKEALDSHSLRL